MNRRPQPPPPYREAGRARRTAPAAMAGWLFADLMLVLALVFLGDSPAPATAQRQPAVPSPSAEEPGAGPEESPSPAPPSSSSSAPSSSPSPGDHRSVENAPVKFRVRGDDRDKLTAQLEKATGDWAGRRAALVLTFGGGPGGTEYARRVNSLLPRARPEMFTRNTTAEDFHDLGEPTSTAELWLYFYTSPR
ncbi:hypothetical protein [Streptomyces sp. HB2AG]|uniref:hypothetical protein n=1 Tax=Streptomyces sp. HB2AG TaxID=2983400 RepID=UPI0022AB04FB|nr:hypothetical protein [Streptomyces sp. HB2AG]MCZ2524606.1 hypothetical protein [Streptomyces sp. HB2AG]